MFQLILITLSLLQCLISAFFPQENLIRISSVCSHAKTSDLIKSKRRVKEANLAAAVLWRALVLLSPLIWFALHRQGNSLLWRLPLLRWVTLQDKVSTQWQLCGVKACLNLEQTEHTRLCSGEVSGIFRLKRKTRRNYHQCGYSDCRGQLSSSCSSGLALLY